MMITLIFCSHQKSWYSNKPYKQILINLEKAGYDLSNRKDTNDVIKIDVCNWSMEDINKIKNVINPILSFKPEENKEKDSLLWICSKYDIILYKDFVDDSLDARYKIILLFLPRNNSNNSKYIENQFN